MQAVVRSIPMHNTQAVVRSIPMHNTQAVVRSTPMPPELAVGARVVVVVAACANQPALWCPWRWWCTALHAWHRK